MRADGKKKTERTEHLEKQEFGSPNFAKKKERNKKKTTTENFRGHNVTKLNQVSHLSPVQVNLTSQTVCTKV